MEIIKNTVVPTGNILIGKGDKGLLEFLSIGDYGKEKNLKANFLGLGNEINGVPHGDLLPLSEKWVVTISSQYGCSMGCEFCDVPKVGPGRNATFKDLNDQVFNAIKLHPEINYTKRLNLHYARMGEPTFNWDVVNSAIYLAGYFKYLGWGFHPVVSTMMPRLMGNLDIFLKSWMWVKNGILNGNAGLQLSINTTDDKAREHLFGGNAMTLEEIAYHVGHFKVKGRKIALNFAISDEYPIDADILINLFNPDKFLCKITPMHATTSCKENDLKTSHGYSYYYPYQDVEKRLIKVGYDVIVFVPSIEEDESKITCGNAILSNNKE
jgi:23S rRNA (adenine2503-C2)-methyltransferase